MATKQSKERQREQNGRKPTTKLSKSAQEIFLDGFKSAEDQFKSIGLEESEVKKKKRDRYNYETKEERFISTQDEGWKRTLMQSEKVGAFFKSNDEQGEKSKRVKKNDLKTFHLDEQFAYTQNTSIFDRSFNFRKSRTSSSSSSSRRKEAINVDQSTLSKAKRNRRTAEEIVDVRSRLPDDSLLEVLQYFSSLYYDKHKILHDTVHSLKKVEGDEEEGDGGGDGDGDGEEEKEEEEEEEQKRIDQSRTQYGMRQVCEGNALIAIAIYLEELVKWESEKMSQRQDIIISSSPSSSSSSSSSPSKTALDRLAELRRRERGARFSQSVSKGKN